MENGKVYKGELRKIRIEEVDGALTLVLKKGRALMMQVKYKSGVTEDFDFQRGDQITIVLDVGKMYHGKLLEIDEERGGFLAVLDDKEKEEFFAFADLLVATTPDQAYFWTEEWQKGEREADEDIKAGRVSPKFETAEEAIKWLESDNDDD